MFDPDNTPGGYGGIDTEAIFQLLGFILFFIVLIIAVGAIIYIFILKAKLKKYETQETKDKQEI